MLPEPHAVLGGRLARGLRDVSSDWSALDSPGFWVAVVTFEGETVCARFDDVRPAPAYDDRPWRGPSRESWASSLDRAAYEAGVGTIRERIAAGDVYQANLCRVLTAPLADPGQPLDTLAAALARGNPAPYAALVDLPAHGVRVVSASPELYLSRAGSTVRSSPVKGTALTPEGLTAKDRAENVMIVDLVRNDLSRVAESGSVTVPALYDVERHPGLVHLVSTVQARIPPGAGWADLLSASFPPGSVSGAPKSSALRIIEELEPVPRGPYCGAIGWVDGDTGVLAVGIRTFWLADDRLCFGTGAGITWGSDAAAEWAETEVKAARLLQVAAGEAG